MSAQAPFLTEVTFYCPECGKKRKAEVKVWVVQKKNCFAFGCKECRNWWIIDIRAAIGAQASATPPGGNPPPSEPQVQMFERVTSELQPMVRKILAERNRVRFFKSIGKTIEVQPLGKIKIDNPDLFNLAAGLDGWEKGKMAGMRIKTGAKIRGLKK